jgi:hypothetical protein
VISDIFPSYFLNLRSISPQTRHGAIGPRNQNIKQYLFIHGELPYGKLFAMNFLCDKEQTNREL